MSSKKKANRGSTQKKRKEDETEKSFGEQLKEAMLQTQISQFTEEQNINASILEYLLADDKVSLDKILRKSSRQSIKDIIERFITSKIPHFLQTLIKKIETDQQSEYCYPWILHILCIHSNSIDHNNMAKLKNLITFSSDKKLELLSISGKIQLLTA